MLLEGIKDPVIIMLVHQPADLAAQGLDPYMWEEVISTPAAALTDVVKERAKAVSEGGWGIDHKYMQRRIDQDLAVRSQTLLRISIGEWWQTSRTRRCLPWLATRCVLSHATCLETVPLETWMSSCLEMAFPCQWSPWSLTRSFQWVEGTLFPWSTGGGGGDTGWTCPLTPLSPRAERPKVRWCHEQRKGTILW